MDLTVIVPIYNTERAKLERCFESIRRIQDIAYECLLVDDGSDQGTAQFSREYAQNNSHFRYIRKENGGVSSARNLGIQEASGKFVCFVDSDDAIEPKAYTKKALLDEAYDVIFTDLIMLHNNKQSLWRAFENTGELRYEDAVERVARDSSLNGPYCKFIKHDFLTSQDILFNQSMVSGEDAVFLMNLLQKRPRMCYKNLMSYYYYHSSASGDSRFLKYPERCVRDLQIQYDTAIECMRTGAFDQDRRITLIRNQKERLVTDLFGRALDSVQFDVLTKQLQETIQDMVPFSRKGCPADVGIKTNVRVRLLNNKNWSFLKIMVLMRKCYLKLKGWR